MNHPKFPEFHQFLSAPGTILPCLRLNFHPPPRAGEAPAEGDGLDGPYGLGSYGTRSLGTLNQMFLVLSVATGRSKVGEIHGKSMGVQWISRAIFVWELIGFSRDLMGISQGDIMCNMIKWR